MNLILNSDTFSSSSKSPERLASILGTWTGQTHLKTDVGSYELLAYFVVHFMPDPMRGYGCSLEDCIEEKNQACVIGSDYEGVCSDLAGEVLDWSDVAAFIYFGARIDAGFPFNKHNAEDTGGWVGPLNIIMASGEKPAPNENDEEVVVDRYVSRYVKSPLTQYLKMPKNCTLLGEDDFNKVAGPIAVDSTTKGQYNPNANINDKDYDPYHAQLGTCANGDVEPLLPLFEFDFEQNKETGDEQIQVKLAYKFLTMPNKGDYMYNLFPMVQRRFNKADLGFHISGPYCYGDDPKRGYTFDMNIDTRDPKAMLKLDHACIEGLPCTPPAAELNNARSDIPTVEPMANDDGTTVSVGKTFGFVLIIITLFFMLLFSCVRNHMYRRQLKRLNDDNNGDSVEYQNESTSTPYQSLDDQDIDDQDIDDEDTNINVRTTENDEINDDQEEEEENIVVDITSTTPLIEKSENGIV